MCFFPFSSTLVQPLRPHAISGRTCERTRMVTEPMDIDDIGRRLGAMKVTQKVKRRITRLDAGAEGRKGKWQRHLADEMGIYGLSYSRM